MKRSKSLTNIAKSKQKYRGRLSARNRYNGRRSRNSVIEYEDDLFPNSDIVPFSSPEKRDNLYSRPHVGQNSTEPVHTEGSDKKSLVSILTGLLKKDAESSKIFMREFEGTNRCFVNGQEWGDMLWLNLKGHLSDLSSSRGNWNGVDYAECIVAKRRTGVLVIYDILNFRVSVPSKLTDSTLNSLYIRHVIETRKRVSQLLDNLEKFSSLFPSTKSMNEYLKIQGLENKLSILEDLVCVLNAWFNTVNNLNDKIEQFRTVFRIGKNDAWPRNLDSKDNDDSPSCESVKSARRVFRNVVEFSLDLKGMQKLLRRVSSMSDVTLRNASAQLNNPVKSYSEVVARKKSRDDKPSDSQYGTKSNLFALMRLPNYSPFFEFILGIKMELILEWLSVRRDIKLGSGNNDESLIFEAIMEDCRDCVEETIICKKNYTAVVQATGGMFRKTYDDSLDDSLRDVFINYLKYLSKWSCAIARDYANVWTVVEDQWREALILSRSIHMGITYQSSYFLSLISSLFMKCVVYYFQTVKCPSFLRDDKIHETGGYAAVQLCREYNRILTDVQNRSQRIFALLHTVTSHFRIAAGYSLKCSLKKAVRYFQQKHYLIETEKHSGVAIVIDDVAMRHDNEKQLCYSLFNCRKEFGSHGYLMAIPDPDRVFRDNWSQKRLDSQQGDQLIVLRQLRTDMACVLGSFDLKNSNLKDILELKSSCCSTFENIDVHIASAIENLLEQVDALGESMLEMMESLNEEVDVGDNVITMFRHAFYTMFQLHRETYKILAEAGTTEQLKILLKQGLSMMDSWVKLVRFSYCDSENAKIPPIDIDKLVLSDNPCILPVWSRTSFTFSVFLLEKCADILSEKQYENLQSKVKELILLVGRSPDSNALHNPRKLTQVNNSYRRKVLRFGEFHSFEQNCKKLDEKLALKSEATIGRVLNAQKIVEVRRRDSRNEKQQWHVQKLIGRGATAVVHNAIHLESLKVIAVKIIRHTERNHDMWLNEVELMKKLNHPNIVKYVGHLSCPNLGEMHIAMEFCMYTLESYCDGPMTIKDIRTITNSLLKAVDYLHEHMIVHRDIKPENIYFDKMQQLKLGDFGVSYLLKSNNTFQGEMVQFIGTPSFMAPEIVTFGGKDENGRLYGYGRAVDIWSFGCVVLNMITSERPWQGYELFPLQFALGTGNLPNNLKKVARGLGRDFILKCLVFKPEDRKKAVELLQDDFVNLEVDYKTAEAPDSGTV